MSILAAASLPVKTMTTPIRGDRPAIIQGIARLLWVQWCLENGVQYEGFHSAPVAFQEVLIKSAASLVGAVLDSSANPL